MRPDGEIFRKDCVFVARFGAQKVPREVWYPKAKRIVMLMDAINTLERRQDLV